MGEVGIALRQEQGALALGQPLLHQADQLRQEGGGGQLKSRMTPAQARMRHWARISWAARRGSAPPWMGWLAPTSISPPWAWGGSGAWASRPWPSIARP